MEQRRRTALAGIVTTLTAGCSGRIGGDPDDGTPPEEPGSETPACDPEDVTRPPVASGANIDGRAYPRKPAPLTPDSVLTYLDDFETAFAWNRVLESSATVTSLNVDNLDGFTPDETGDGYLASSGIRVSYDTDGGSPSEREYVANYFVTPGPVYRYESSADSVAPDPSDEETVLVQCGADG